jgi:hypothetical protein
MCVELGIDDLAHGPLGQRFEGRVERVEVTGLGHGVPSCTAECAKGLHVRLANAHRIAD